MCKDHNIVHPSVCPPAPPKHTISCIHDFHCDLHSFGSLLCSTFLCKFNTSLRIVWNTSKKKEGSKVGFKRDIGPYQMTEKKLNKMAITIDLMNWWHILLSFYLLRDTSTFGFSVKKFSRYNETKWSWSNESHLICLKLL